MNLWVRSQDKENLIPIKNPICVYDNKIIYKESASYVITIGTYKTKERAIEVLDEIQNFMRDYAFTKINRLGKEINLIPKPILIYNMPEK